MTTQPAQPEQRRQLVKYNFYQLDPAWRALPERERENGKRQFQAVCEEFGKTLSLRSYSTVGIRADTDFMLWLLSWELEPIQEFAAQINRTALAPYLKTTYAYLALTRKSPYMDSSQRVGPERTRIIPPTKQYPYLIVYPFVKTNDWYQLPQAERQGMMNQHFEIGHKYPSVRNNTTYSFGIDDQEHVVSFETTSLSDFLELVMELRESKARPFTLRDTPIFTCAQKPIAEILTSLG
ncbi:MAG: chlorite dismutase [Dehalococcoidia bacterium]|nr:chlorite dismutase [Dehalococcoidia bacterium]